MRVLVTGSSGNIGSAVAKHAAQHGDVIGLDVRPGEHTTHVGTVEDVPFLDKIVPEVDGIIHCAAFLTPHVGVQPNSRFEDVNVHGTENLLNLAIEHGLASFVLTSTTSVYGCSTRPKTEAVWATEELEPYPEDIYDTTKLRAEQLCRDAFARGLKTTALRMSRCFPIHGPEPDHLTAIYRLYRGVDHNDVAHAHWLALTAHLDDFEIFNVSGDSPFQPADCGELLADPWSVIHRYFPGCGARFDQLGWEKPKSIDRVYVIEKAKRMLGYAPQQNFAEIMRRHP